MALTVLYALCALDRPPCLPSTFSPPAEHHRHPLALPTRHRDECCRDAAPKLRAEIVNLRIVRQRDCGREKRTRPYPAPIRMGMGAV